MFVFQKIWRALFSSNARFEIHPFTLLLTKWQSTILEKYICSPKIGMKFAKMGVEIVFSLVF